MRLAVLKESNAGETRVAATPESIKKLLSLGLTVVVQAGAGALSSISDEDYRAAGAEIAPDAKAALMGAGIVLAVRTPSAAIRSEIPRGAALICVMGAFADPD
ncbi:MAG TPA: NAD(P)(+) transhydrogenase (Re/Si-specific) subunit alpha, partial [Acetobacteraceae bacterium]|nr:NAD(P)(+) transhydrogenase (Re/Si-specific) subunit alpha [Acetobacteraceae bacterium]